MRALQNEGLTSAETRNLLDKELLTVSEVSSILRVSWVTAARMIGNGLEGVNIGAKPSKAYWRIYSRSVKKILGIEEQIPA